MHRHLSGCHLPLFSQLSGLSHRLFSLSQRFFLQSVHLHLLFLQQFLLQSLSRCCSIPNRCQLHYVQYQSLSGLSKYYALQDLQWYLSAHSGEQYFELYIGVSDGTGVQFYALSLPGYSCYCGSHQYCRVGHSALLDYCGSSCVDFRAIFGQIQISAELIGGADVYHAQFGQHHSHGQSHRCGN